MGKKRALSIFDAIEELETQDRRADGKRHQQQRADQQRAKDVQQQTKIYHHLVQSRILLQRAIQNNNNKKPKAFKETLMDTTSSVSKFRDCCNDLLEQLLVTRNQLAGFGNPEQDPKYYKDILLSSHSSSRLTETLQEEYQHHREQWKHILNQRHKSLQLQSGVTAKSTQFRVMDASFWQQVEATVEYETIRSSNNNNGHLFVDDSKVYQQLLKEFVSTHTIQAGADATATAAERLRLAQRKSKKERGQQLKAVTVDRRASKGRKLRIKEIPKLVNFAFPLSRPASTSLNNLNQDEYFRSLFGGSATATTAMTKGSQK